MKKKKILAKGKRFREILEPPNNYLRRIGMPMRRSYLNKRYIIIRKCN